MSEHKIGTREEWQAAREELAKLEAEQAQRNEAVKTKRLELPWVPVEKEYVFDTEDGRRRWWSFSTVARSFSLTTSCTGRSTRSAHAPAVPISATV